MTVLVRLAAPPNSGMRSSRLRTHHVAAGRHGRPFHLKLTGPAGGQWSSELTGEPESIRMDAIEFCRTLSGRETGVGLLSIEVPF